MFSVPSPCIEEKSINSNHDRDVIYNRQIELAVDRVKSWNVFIIYILFVHQRKYPKNWNMSIWYINIWNPYEEGLW